MGLALAPEAPHPRRADPGPRRRRDRRLQGPRPRDRRHRHRAPHRAQHGRGHGPRRPDHRPRLRPHASPPARRPRSAPTRPSRPPTSAPDDPRASTALDAGYGPVQVLRGLSLAVAPGEVLCLMGRNGAGKSTALKAIMGLVRATAGSVRLDATRLDTPARPRGPPPRRRLGAAGPPPLRRAHRRREPRDRPAHPRPAAPPTRERALALFPRLRERLAQASGTLSGGEQQMLAIARALCTEPAGPAPRRAHRGPAALDDRADPRHHRRAEGRPASPPSSSSSASTPPSPSPTASPSSPTARVAETLPAAGLAPDAPQFRTYVGV